MKKIIALLLTLCIAFSMAACGQTAAPAADTAAAPAEAADTASSAPATLTKLTVCGTNGNGDTQSIAHQNLAKYLNELGGWDAVAMVSSEMG